MDSKVLRSPTNYKFTGIRVRVTYGPSYVGRLTHLHITNVVHNIILGTWVLYRLIQKIGLLNGDDGSDH